MSTPDPKTVREIAREAVRRGGSDSGYGFIGSVISDHAAMDEMLASGDRAAFGRLHAAVRAELKGATITVEWPDEQQPADVVTAEVKCGRECSEMHTYEPGSREAAVTAEQQQDGAVEELRTFLDALPPRIDIVADWTRGGVRNVLTAEALRVVLAERTALAEQLAAATAELGRVNRRADFLDGALDGMRQQAIEAVKARNAATARAESATVLPERWRALIAERDAANERAEKAERASRLLVVGQNELDRQWAETDAATRAEFEVAMNKLRGRAEEAEALAASPRQLRAAFVAGWHSHSAAMNGALATVGWEERDEAAKHWARGFAGDAEAADAASASRTERKLVPPRPTSDMSLTPDEWCRAYDVTVHDPDGWRGKDEPLWDTPITLAEFSRRANRSTVDAANPAWDGVARDVRLCASESASELTKTEKP